MFAMADNAESPRRRCYQFRLRTLLIVVAAVAVLAAQWPWWEIVPESTGPVSTQAADGSTIIHLYCEPRARVLTWRFIVTFAAECIVGVTWMNMVIVRRMVA